jgi:hypothetical protein
MYLPCRIRSPRVERGSNIPVLNELDKIHVLLVLILSFFFSLASGQVVVQ